MTFMDLTTQHPRSANEMMAGLVSLARMTDKARASIDGTLGDYHFDCPHDAPLLAFLGVSAPDFAQHVRDLQSDEKIEAWVRDDLLKSKTPAQIAEFNESRSAWRPDAGSPSAEYFEGLRTQVAPGRSDIVTWFDVLDLDEGRTVAHAHA